MVNSNVTIAPLRDEFSGLNVKEYRDLSAEPIIDEWQFLTMPEKDIR